MDQPPSLRSNSSASYKELTEKDEEFSSELVDERDRLSDARDRLSASGYCGYCKANGQRVIELIARTLDSKYDRLFKAAIAGREKEFFVSLSFHKRQLEAMHACLELLRKDYPIPPDFARFGISKLLMALSVRMLYDRMMDPIQALMQKLVECLSKIERNRLLGILIEQMHGLSNGGQTLQIWHENEPREMYRVTVRASLLNDVPVSLLISLVDLLTTSIGLFDVKTIGLRKEIQLWMVVFYLAKKTISGPSQRSQEASTKLMHSLLSLEIATLEMVRIAVDHSFAFIKIQASRKAEMQSPQLHANINAIFKLLATSLRKATTCKFIKGLQTTILLDWALKAALRLNSQKIDGLSLFSAACMQLLILMNEDARGLHQDEIRRIAGPVKRLVERALEAGQEVKGWLPFLLFSDQVLDERSNSEWIVDTCQLTLSRMESLLKALLKRSIICKALSSGPSTPCSAELLNLLTPTEKELKHVGEKVAELNEVDAKKFGPPVLKAMFDVLSQLVGLPQTSPSPSATAVAFLSLPWLSDAEVGTQITRHARSIPLLKHMRKLAMNCKTTFDKLPELRACTLSALSSFPRGLHSEWRRTLLTHALHLTPTKQNPSELSANLARAALATMPFFVRSLDHSAVKYLLESMVQLIDHDNPFDSKVYVGEVLVAMGNSLCATDERTKGDECQGCADLLKTRPVWTPRPIDLPPTLDSLLQVIFSTSPTDVQVQQRLDSYSVLFDLLAHVTGAMEKLPKAVRASLHLVKDTDKEIRSDYDCAFKVIILSNPSPELLEEIMHEFQVPDGPQKETRAMYEYSGSFLTHCALLSTNEEFSLWARCELFKRALHFPESKQLVRHARELHKLLAEKYVNGNTLRMFYQQIRRLSSMLTEELLLVAEDALHDEELPNERAREEDMEKGLNDLLQSAVQIWGFSNVESLVRSAGAYIASGCFMVKLLEIRRAAVEKVLDKIATILGKDRGAMISEFFPFIIEKIMSRPEGQESRSILSFAIQYGETELRTLFVDRRYMCILFILRSLSINEDSSIGMLAKIYKNFTDEKREPFSVSAILRNRCEYLGFFLILRRNILQDEFVELRHITLRSLTAIISLVDSRFIEETASKIMMLLRSATPLGEGALPAWEKFVERMEKETLVSLLPQILITVQPLLVHDSSSKILRSIFEHRDALDDEQKVAFKRAVLIILGEDGGSKGRQDDEDMASLHIRRYLRAQDHGSGEQGREAIILGCAYLLEREGESVGRVVLSRLERVLDGVPIDDDAAAAIIPALLHAVRTFRDTRLKSVATRCLGLVGAVDPGRLGLSQENKWRVDGPSGGKKKTVLFVSSRNHDFFVDLVVRSWRVYVNHLTADMIDYISIGIQRLLHTVVGKDDVNGILPRLPDECRREVEPLNRSSLTSSIVINRVDAKGGPIVHVVGSFGDWMLQTYLAGITKVSGQLLAKVFESLKWLMYTKDESFSRHAIVHLLTVFIVQANDDAAQNFAQELIAVLRLTVSDKSPPWVRLAAHVVFSCIDILEAFEVAKSSTMRKGDKPELTRVRSLLGMLHGERLEGQLLIVVAAEKCQCLLRALRWCEQYGMNGTNGFNRASFHNLQRLYMQLTDVDGVAGAFESIVTHTDPTPDEQILAYEANGDYNEALPLYSQSTRNKEQKLLKCLLRLNQPQLALSTASSHKELPNLDDNTRGVLEGVQLEAAWHLGDWARLDALVKEHDPLKRKDTRNFSWGSACASIMSSIHQREADKLQGKIEMARGRLAERLTAMAIEDSNTYTQAYKYITQLHSLAEIEDAKEALSLLRSESVTDAEVTRLLVQWQTRSEAATQCAPALEPMLRVHRELLRAAKGPATQGAICNLLLQSSRLARQAGHLQIAWTFLVDAKSMNTDHQAVGMEEARYEFQKGNQSEAIGLLGRLLTTRFPRMHEIFNICARKNSPSPLSQLSSVGVEVIHSVLTDKEKKLAPSVLIKERTTKEERAVYAEIQLLRTEYMLKAGSVSTKDLYGTYTALSKFEVPSEDLHYRAAVFYDNMLNLNQGEAPRTDLVTAVIQAYGQVLRFGRSHLFHAMPRMLTIWLDSTQKICEIRDAIAEERQRKSGEKKEEPSLKEKELTSSITALNVTMRRQLDELPLVTFFTAFPQLISRILHPDQTVFDLIAKMLATLIGSFPHQCLWQSIAVYRTPIDQKKRSRCREVFDRVKQRHPHLVGLIDQYDYVSHQLIEIAEKKAKECRKLSDINKELIEFFRSGTMNVSKLVSGSKVKKVMKTEVMLPLTAMMEGALPSREDIREESSQWQMEQGSPRHDDHAPVELFIKSVEEDILVLSSMQQPKRIGFRATDGRVYYIMCKREDELRKDSRFMDFSRMMNCLMRRSPDARRRQLMVRTYSVVPLQSKGGIIEWIPNLNTYKNTLTRLFEEFSGVSSNEIDIPAHWDNGWPVERKLHEMRTYFYSVYPKVAAEWLRRTFVDPCSWYSARQLLARSCSVMSMIGFVLGLGDRHAENLAIDQGDGCLVHVDFNLLFDKGEGLKIPEVVPFRLTRNLVDAFGPTGVEGSFRKAAEVTLQVMRANTDTLITVLQAFVHDPLVEWASAPSRAQQSRQPGTGIEKAITTAKGADEALDHVELIRNRLQGHIVTKKSSARKSTMKAPPMSVNGQVAKLILIATDEATLAQMFGGWGPYI